MGWLGGAAPSVRATSRYAWGGVGRAAAGRSRRARASPPAGVVEGEVVLHIADVVRRELRALLAQITEEDLLRVDVVREGRRRHGRRLSCWPFAERTQKGWYITLCFWQNNRISAS